MLALSIYVVLLWFVMPALLLLVGKMASRFTRRRKDGLIGFPSDRPTLAARQRAAAKRKV